LQDPPKCTQSAIFGFENKPSGNPDCYALGQSEVGQPSPSRRFLSPFSSNKKTKKSWRGQRMNSKAKKKLKLKFKTFFNYSIRGQMAQQTKKIKILTKVFFAFFLHGKGVT
jgi:hypothetical protein